MGFYLCSFLSRCLLQGSASPFTKTPRPDPHFHFPRTFTIPFSTGISLLPLSACARELPASAPVPQSPQLMILRPFVSVNPVITATVCQRGHYVISSGSFSSLFAITQILLISLSNEQEKRGKKPQKTPQETLTQCQ